MQVVEEEQEEEDVDLDKGELPKAEAPEQQAKEVRAAGRPQTSQHLEELLRIVEPSVGSERLEKGGILDSDLLFSEAMHGLFLLASGASGGLDEVSPPITAGADGGADGTDTTTVPAAGSVPTSVAAPRKPQSSARGARAEASRRAGQQQQPRQQQQRRQKEAQPKAPEVLSQPTVLTAACGGRDAGVGDASVTETVAKAQPAASAGGIDKDAAATAAPTGDACRGQGAAAANASTMGAEAQQAAATDAKPDDARPEAKPEAKPKEARPEDVRQEAKPEAEHQERPAAEPIAPLDAKAVEKPEVPSSKPLAADAPDFVPFSMMQPSEDAMRSRNSARRGRRGRQAEGEGSFPAIEDPSVPESLPITTVMISGIQAHHTAESFRQQLDTWGLLGTYNFFHMPADRQGHMGTGFAFVNFIDPTFAQLCQMLFQQYQFEGTATPFHVQGLENNVAHWSQFTDPEDTLNAPLIIPTPTPSQWAVNGVNTMLNTKFSPQIREQFHKTKLCVFHKKNKCALASSCPFAHTREELQPAPDLAKTKLCYNFFRRKCNDTRCKFAHGYTELRATNNVYKTELCRWWSYGSCKAGSSCRYAHGMEELRHSGYGMPGESSMPMEGMPFIATQEYYEGMDCMTNEAIDSEGPSQPSPLFVAPQADGSFEDYKTMGVPMQPALNKWEEPPESWCKTQPVPSDSLDDGTSDMGFSDASTFLGTMDHKIHRQQTAPPTSSFISELPQLESGHDNIVLRVKGTFMEALQIDMEPLVPLHRSWSDGDLPQLCEVMECMEVYNNEC
eukprot:CAMPEP_0179072716 /NCGR_PEP_ID=MMETSP0796-20121207/32199_1 /TAXON_ID=73915 /ORGANISM="Pyrodinium bahamense, Strain pbaha01" /LENGTH=787 /DNA_ID=CAMNT_0020769887 /DNA_START=1 /DNA_END=2365 /DNA_ORIENTATION=+